MRASTSHNKGQLQYNFEFFLQKWVLDGPNQKTLESGPPLKFEKLFGSSLYCGVSFTKKRL